MVGTLRVFVAGATGMLGRRVVAELVDRGHVAVGLTRDREGDELVAARGGVPRRGDVLDRESVEWAAADADVVVHAASAVPTDRKPDEEAWARNDRVRRQGARNLTNAAAVGEARRYVQASVVWVARDDDGTAIDESADPNPDRTTRSALEAEQRARAAARFGLAPVVLRCGWLYAHDAAHTRRMARDLLRGRLPVVGGGLLGRRDAEVSLVHPDDAARAFADAAEGSPGAGGNARRAGGGDARRSTGDTARRAAGPAGDGPAGLYHVVDEEPVTVARFLRAFAERLGAPRPRRIPGWLARPFVGAETTRFLTTGFPTRAERFRRAYGWQPEYPTYRGGLDAVVDRWRREGVLVEADDGYEWRGP